MTVDTLLPLNRFSMNNTIKCRLPTMLKAISCNIAKFGSTPKFSGLFFGPCYMVPLNLKKISSLGYAQSCLQTILHNPAYKQSSKQTDRQQNRRALGKCGPPPRIVEFSMIHKPATATKLLFFYIAYVL